MFFFRYIFFERSCIDDYENDLKESKKQLNALAGFLHFSDKCSSDIVGKYMFDFTEDILLGKGIPSRFEPSDESLLDEQINLRASLSKTRQRCREYDVDDDEEINSFSSSYSLNE